MEELRMKVARRCNWILLSVSLGLLMAVPAFAQTPGKRLHKMLIHPGRNDSIAQLESSGITNVENYGSFWLVQANDAQEAALKKAFGSRASQADQFNRIEMSSISLDTTEPEPVLPDNLRQTNPVGKRLRLVQFQGPIQPEWLDQLKEGGAVQVVNYVPNNAYVVWLDQSAEDNLAKLIAPSGPIQWIGPYHPYYKMRPDLLNAPTSTIEVQIGFVNTPDSDQTLLAINRYAIGEPGRSKLTGAQIVTRITVTPVSLVGIAQISDVLWIERCAPLESKDEVQDLISADRVSQPPGNGPVPGVDDYLDFLTNVVGFSTNPAEYPILDVADEDGEQALNFNDFFEFGNPSNTTRLVGFIGLCAPGATYCVTLPHAPFVMSVASGYNDSKSDPVNLDSNGFRKGLGISPFGRISNMAIFNLSGSDCIVCVPNASHPSLLDIPLNEYQDFGARISNNSWGQSPVAGNGGNVGIYDGDSLDYDIAVRDALDSGSSVINTNGQPSFSLALNQEMVTIFAGGNAQGLGSGNGGFGDIIITPPATAKNVISVGASENVRSLADATNCVQFPSEADNSFDISTFSSFGPTLDQRFKPEIVAPGSGIFGVDGFATFFTLVGTNLVPATGNAYTCASGTSFAAPAVSAAAQLLWWWFEHRLQDEQGQNLLQPSPAMAKAYICNSARYLPLIDPKSGALESLPSKAEGMGELDLARMFDGVPRLIRDETTRRAIDTPLSTTNPVPQQTFFSRSGQSYEVSGAVADSTKPFRVTVAWLDAPGDPTAFKQLVNDLNLEVTVGGHTYYGNRFNGPDSLPDPASQNLSADDINNVESVFLPAGQAGPWSVVVTAENIAGAGVPNIDTPVGQDFALVVYNASDAPSARSDVPNLSTNDSCQTAAPITTFPFAFTNNLTKAVYHNVHPSPSAAIGGAEEFFQINRPTTGTQFTIDTVGSSFNTVLSVWRVLVVPQPVYVSGPCGALIETVSTFSTNVSSQSSVTFTADGSNTYFVVVEPLDDGPGGNLVLNVSATSQVSLSVSNLNFGSQVGGTTSVVQTVTLTNSSPGGINVSDIAIEGDDPSDFLLVSQSCRGHTIPSGGSCAIGLAFTPTTTGLRTARLVVRDDATGSPRIAQLSGTGLPPAPVVCLGATSLDFGSQGVPSTSTVQNVMVTNCGTTNLTISGVALIGANAGSFHIVTNACSTLAAGASCSIGLIFTPTDGGPVAATLAITDNAAGSPHLVSLTGTGSIGQPDARIGKTRNLKTMRGGGVLNSTGVGQRIVRNLQRGGNHAAKFFIAVKNKGTSPDQFTVEGTGSSAGFTVRYFLGAAAPVDITSAVEAGTHASGTLAPTAVTSDATMIRVQISADKNVPRGTAKQFTIKFTSVADPTKVDVVIAKVIVK